MLNPIQGHLPTLPSMRYNTGFSPFVNTEGQINREEFKNRDKIFK